MRTSITSSTSGSQRFDVFSSSATLLPGQNAIATTSAITLTLPAATTTRSTRVANTSEAAITVSGGASTINGASTLSLDSGAIGEFYPQAGAWVAIGGAIGASRITTGLLDAARIPNLPASQLTSGVLDVARIPGLPASQITTGKISVDRIGATGTPSSATYLRGDNTWASGGAVTVQADPPTTSSNSTLGSFVYSTNDSRLYLCTDATTNNNVWRYWSSSGVVDSVQLPYPGGTLVNGAGANHSSNTTIANADILWYIGTNQLTTSYTNPVDGTRIVQTNSGVLSNPVVYGSPVVLADRVLSNTSALNYLSTDVSQSWFQFNFGVTTRVALTKIAMQNRGDATGFFRTLSIRYSSNGSTFTQAISTTSTANSMGEWYTFDVSNFPSSQYLRIVHTSTDASGANMFRAAEILLYGTISYV